MGVRKVKEGYGYKVGYDYDWNEYQVGPSDQKWGSEGMYHTDDRADAWDTWESMTGKARAQERYQELEDRDELDLH